MNCPERLKLRTPDSSPWPFPPDLTGQNREVWVTLVSGGMGCRGKCLDPVSPRQEHLLGYPSDSASVTAWLCGLGQAISPLQGVVTSSLDKQIAL